MTNNVVQIINPLGEINKYITFETRLPKFLEMYSPLDGYTVIVESSDYLSQNPGLLAIYKEAIAGGNNPTELGLPAIREMMIFTAKLLKDGKVLQTASACKVINAYKDYEIGETAARQRLIASLGFSSGEFDIDENLDMDQQGLKHKFNPNFSLPQDVEQDFNSDQGFINNESVTPSNSEPESQPQHVVHQAPQVQTEKQSDTDPNAHISVQLMRKIYQKATIKDIEVPVFNDEQDAKAFYKTLLK